LPACQQTGKFRKEEVDEWVHSGGREVTNIVPTIQAMKKDSLMKSGLFTAVSLFSGAMGLDIGLEETGRFRLLACVENEPVFCETIRFNFNSKLYMALEASVGKSVEAAFLGQYPLLKQNKCTDPPEKIAELEALSGLSREEKAPSHPFRLA